MNSKEIVEISEKISEISKEINATKMFAEEFDKRSEKEYRQIVVDVKDLYTNAPIFYSHMGKEGVNMFKKYCQNEIERLEKELEELVKSIK